MHYPRISIERAMAMAEAAVQAGLARWTEEEHLFRPEPVFRAELARHGVGRLTELSVDQAEHVESFIGAYALGSRHDEVPA
jgi:hypothetical protein